MPNYRFRCPQCQHVFEELLTVAVFSQTRDERLCPVCQGVSEHVIGVPAPIRTVSRYLSRFGTLLDQFGDTPDGRKRLNHRIAEAKRLGHTPGYRDVYDPTLALRPGDPAGFIAHDDPAGHVKRRLGSMGVGCEGGISPTPTGPGRPGPSKALANDSVDDLVARRIAADPALKEKDLSTVKEEVIATHSYSRRRQ